MRLSRRLIVTASVLTAGFAPAAHGQTWEPDAAEIRFQVWNGNEWSSSASLVPGQRYEWRAVVSYTGTRTDLFALGEALYQPTVSNTDNIGGSLGGNADEFGPFRGPIDTGNAVPGTILTAAEGNDSGPLTSYGRVSYGLAATGTSQFNVATVFRHSSGGQGAPSGEHMRIAGSYVSTWPRALLGPAPPLDVTTADLNRVLRGVNSGQSSEAQQPLFHTPGTQSLVVYRQSLTVTTEDPHRPQMVISTFPESLKRWGGATGTGEGDDRRYISWQTGPSDPGTSFSGHRTGVVIIPATLDPAPAQITVQPHFVHQGSGPLADFIVQLAVVGGGPITYQWRLNGVPISNTAGRFDGVDTNSLRILAWSYSDFGDYDCIVNSPTGTLISQSFHFSRPTVPASGPVSVEPIAVGIIGHPTAPDQWLGNFLAFRTGPTTAIIQGDVSSAAGPNNPQIRVFAKWDDGTITRLLTSGTPAPGPGPDATWSNLNLIAAAGETLFFDSINAGFNYPSTWRLQDGAPTLLTATGYEAPGLPGFTVQPFAGSGCVGGDGTIYFDQFVTDGTPFQTAWWHVPPAGTPAFMSKQDDAMPGTTGTLFSSDPSYMLAGPPDELAWVQTIKHPGVAYNGEAGVWRGSRRRVDVRRPNRRLH